MPAGAGLSLQVLAGDGTVELDQRIAPLHRRVRPAGDHRTGVPQALPRIGVAQPVRAQSRPGKMQVADGMAGLHGRHHAEPGKAGNVHGTDDLGVLDPPAGIRAGLRQGLRIEVEHPGIGLVSNRMGADLNAMDHGVGENGAGILVLEAEQARVRRIIRIGSPERRPAGAQGTVRVELDGTGHHPAVAGGPGTRGEQLVHILPVHGRIDPQGRFPLGGQGFEGQHIAPWRAHEVHAGPAIAVLHRHPDLQGLDPVLRRFGRQDLLEQGHGIVDQHPRQMAGRVLVDRSAEGRRRRRGDPGQPQGGAVDGHGVAVGALQDHRIVRCHGVNVGSLQEALLRPAGLDPAPAEDQLPGLGCRHAGLDPGRHLGGGA